MYRVSRSRRSLGRETPSYWAWERRTTRPVRPSLLSTSEVFRKGWEACRGNEGYQALKREFQREQKEWDKAHKGVKKEEVVKEESEVKEETKVKEESDEG